MPRDIFINALAAGLARLIETSCQSTETRLDLNAESSVYGPAGEPVETTMETQV